MTQQTVPQQQSANDVLMGGGPSVPGFKFADPGDSITGRITAPPSTYQVREYDPNNPGGGALKFYPSGDPIMGLYVDLDTGSKDPMIEGDDGIRRIYIDGRYVKEAVREAVIAAGAQGLQPGGVLQLTFTHREDPMDKRSRKFWQAAYTPAGNAALMGQQTTPQQAAPAQQAPPQQGNNVVQGQFGGQQPPQAPQAQQGYQQPMGQTFQPQQQQAPVANVTQLPEAAPAPQPAAPAQENPADKVTQLIGLGLTDDQIAGATGLDPQVVAQIRANA